MNESNGTNPKKSFIVVACVILGILVYGCIKYIPTRNANDNILNQNPVEQILDNSNNSNTYSLENKSVDDIVNMMKLFSDIHTGDSIEVWEGNFEATPIDKVDHRREAGQPYWSYIFAADNSIDHVESISYLISEEMDHTFTVGDFNRGYVRAELFIKDYTKASTLYNSIYSYYEDVESYLQTEYNSEQHVISVYGDGTPANYGYYDIFLSNNQRGTSWVAEIEWTDYGMPEATFALRMTQVEDGYIIMVDMPVLAGYGV